MKIGILTSGGDTPGMNSVIRAALIKAQQLGHSLIGFQNGWKGLVDNAIMEIPPAIKDQIELGGTILGSGRMNPFKHENALESIKKTIFKNSIDCVIAIGGEDTLGVANKLTEQGFPMVGVPKTIDNDLSATDYTFGFNTAVSIVSDALDRLKTTAKSHQRIIVVEVMGRHAGWVTLHGGLAGGAHVILLPEYPLSSEQICSIIQERYDQGDHWALVVVSEGYGYSDIQSQKQEKDDFGHILLDKLGVGSNVAKMIESALGHSTRAITLGHLQRGGTPSAFDRVLSTQFGIKAIELVNNKKFGEMPALKGNRIVSVNLSDAVATLKTVDEESWNYAKSIMMI
ncbi:MAG: 6-phosphofructokinase [Candidatus Kariarchaeaceae archaeon]|jgi:6-phosphofructokinase 1